MTTLLSIFEREFKFFIISVSFFTRIPINLGLNIQKFEFAASQKYFTLVGLLIGLLTSGSFLFFSFFFSVPISILFSMIFSIFLTGAFHEDGLADTVDGFGGSFALEEKLKIMKDSRIGTFGVISLVLVLILKYHLLMEQPSIILAIILGHTLSRLFASSLQVSLDYVRLEVDSKVKVVTQNLETLFLVPGILISFFILVVSLDYWFIVQVIFCLLGLRWLFIKVYRSQIGGYTGDTLGAAQQLSEIFIYMLLII